VRQHGWVPIGKSKGDRPTPANLAALLDDDLKQHILTDTDSARFLLKLDIGLSDLLRVGVPEAKRFQVDQLSAKIYDSEDATIESIEAVLADPLIRDVVLHKKQEKETVDRNQKVGKLIEDLLRKELEAEKITVRRRPIGSDFEIESDFIEDQQEQLLELGPHLLEVKSTSTPYVRMTLRQGIEECKEENKHRYVLCVVPLVQDPMDEEAVRLNSKFVLGIGSLLEAKVNAAGDLKQLEKDITPSRGEVVEIDMVQSQIKLRIAQPVWQSAKTFTFRQFVDYLRPRKTESPTV